MDTYHYLHKLLGVDHLILGIKNDDIHKKVAYIKILIINIYATKFHLLEMTNIHFKKNQLIRML